MGIAGLVLWRHQAGVVVQRGQARLPLGGDIRLGAEERGQAESIARNLMEMSRLRTPIVSVVCGEGGSGGALGIGVADKVAMMEFAWYSVISPEACSAILFKGNEEAAQLAEALKLTSRDLIKLGMNQGWEVVEHLMGREVEPADRAQLLVT